ncbi:VanZ family protein [Aquabacterium soli]|uniref:VanZ family protein n=1 Tax=Aquabacterium soli TaxID=2493092 RepID=A0A3R8T300_9BURK|nr:VanZ family protein [Aquabacterium soli]RRS04918.1 VanZ family protein [Aquabacterium soli]
MSLHRSTAWPLTWVSMALIVYATLHPLTGWHPPPPGAFNWILPKQSFELPSDLMANLLGYMPLGCVMCVAQLRTDRRPLAAALITVAACSALSYSLELTQFTLPGRVPSISDWALNSLGAAWGVLAAVTAHALGLVDWWHRWRERLFIPQAGWGLALLWVWPLGLLFPPPLPLGEGQIWPPLRLQLVEWTMGTPWESWFLPADDPLSLFVPQAWHDAATATGPLNGGRDALIVALGLLAPMVVACALARPRALRLLLLAGAVGVALVATTFATALNYGPEHAFTWISLPTVIGLLLGSLAGGLLLDRSRRVVALIGLCVLGGLIWMIHQVPPDPYYAQTLMAWEGGRFIRFHGLARWFGLLWPFAAFAWLSGRALGRAA